MSITKIFTDTNSQYVTAFQLTRVDAFKYTFKEKGLCSALLAFFVGRKIEKAEVEQWDGNGTSSIHSKLNSLLNERQIEVCNPDPQKEEESQPTATEKSASASAMCVWLKKENENIIKENEDLIVENARLRSENDSAINANPELKDTKKIEEELRYKVNNIETKISKKSKVLGDIFHEESALISRGMTYNNPAVTTLNDPTRIEKLSNVLFTLYNNGEWIDAAEAIEELEAKELSVYSSEDKLWYKVAKHSPIERKKIACILLYNIFHTLHDNIKVLAKSKLAEMMKENEREIQEEEKRQIAYEKEHGDESEGKPFEKKTPVLKEGDAYSIMLNNMSDYENDIKAINDAVKDTFVRSDDGVLDLYIKELSSLLFRALFRKPPMYFCFNEASDDLYKHELKPFTKNGKRIDFMVWPIIYVSKGEGLIDKGIAQFKDD